MTKFFTKKPREGAQRKKASQVRATRFEESDYDQDQPGLGTLDFEPELFEYELELDDSDGGDAERSDSKRSGKKQSRFLARWFLIIPAVTLIFVALTGFWYYGAAKIWYRETRQERVLREQLAGIQDYNRELHQELASLETTPGIQEYAARELNYVFEGDNVIVVTRDGVPLTEPRTTREDAILSIPENAQPFGAWTDFLDTVFGIE